MAHMPLFHDYVESSPLEAWDQSMDVFVYEPIGLRSDTR